MHTDKNNNNELADWLLLGSRNIDRMIDELYQLTSMLIGVITPSLHDIPEDIELRTSNGVTWVVVFYKTERVTRPNMAIWGCLPIQSNNEPVFNSESSKDKVNRRYVEHFYSQRGILVKGLLSAFPSLIDDMAHFIAASKVKFPD